MYNPVGMLAGPLHSLQHAAGGGEDEAGAAGDGAAEGVGGASGKERGHGPAGAEEETGGRDGIGRDREPYWPSKGLSRRVPQRRRIRYFHHPRRRNHLIEPESDINTR